MQTLTVDIEISKIPSVARLVTAVCNLVKLDTEGVFCSCDKAIDHPSYSKHAPSCIELSEAIKEIKGK